MKPARWMVGAVLLAGSAACGADDRAAPASQPEESVAAAPVETEPRIADSAEWAAEGRRLIEAKTAAARTAPSLPERNNMGPYAYQSDPVVITGDGEYEFVFRGVQDDLDVEVPFGYNLPSDLAGDFLAGIPEVSGVDDAGRTIKLDITMTNVRASLPYPNVTIWIY